MLSVLITGISVCLSLAAGNTLFQIIPYYLISILGLYLYFSVSGIIDVQEKRKILKTNLIDYLENHFVPRLETEKENALEEGIKKREKYAKELLSENFSEKTVVKEKNRTIENPGTRECQEELEYLLEEFFA